MQIRSLGRVDLPLGEALRLEMVDADAGGEDIVHLQYYISTDAGPWALWLTCAREELAGREAALREITPPLMEP
jgi:glycogen debranching enzyme